MLQRRFPAWMALVFLLTIGCRGPKIHGVVTGKDGKPVVEALVYVSVVRGNDLARTESLLTDSYGAYSAFTGRNGSHLYRVLVNHRDFEPVSRVVNTDTTTTINFGLEPRIVFQGPYRVGDEVQARDIEWCPALITDIGTGEYQGDYEIDFPGSGGARLMLRPQNIRPLNAGPTETRFACPFRVKIEPKTHS